MLHRAWKWTHQPHFPLSCFHITVSRGCVKSWRTLYSIVLFSRTKDRSLIMSACCCTDFHQHVYAEQWKPQTIRVKNNVWLQTAVDNNAERKQLKSLCPCDFCGVNKTAKTSLNGHNNFTIYSVSATCQWILSSICILALDVDKEIRNTQKIKWVVE